MTRALTPLAPRASSPEPSTVPRHSILVIHGNNDLYGADKILLELLVRLDRQRFRPIVALPTDTRHINRLSAALEKNGIECIFLPLGVMRRKYLNAVSLPRYCVDVLRGARRLRRLIREQQISIVHTNTNTILSGALAARGEHLPHIWSVHELMVEPALVRRFLHWMIPRFSTRVVTVTRAVRDHMLRDAPQYGDRFEFVCGGIDPQPFLAASGRQRIRSQWNVADDELLVGMAGRVTRWKGQSVFAEAAKVLLERHPRVKFAAIGGVFDTETFYMERFREQVRDLGIEDRFIINDFRADMPDVFAAFDIFVLPSILPEPFGLVVIEAMASARPVVATAPGGPSEIVADGETGYLVAPSDPGPIADRVEKLLLDPALRARLGEAGRKRALELFSLPRYVHEFERLYENVLKAAEPDTHAATAHARL